MHDDHKPNFDRWFRDSQVVDAAGAPLVVYHGTDEHFTEFRIGQAKYGNPNEVGAFFTTNREAAEDYGDRVMSVYLSMQKPYRVTAEQWGNADGLSPAQARAEGYDGSIIEDHDIGGARDDDRDEIHSAMGTTYIVFRPEQIKSANGNSGLYDLANPDISDRIAAAGAALDYLSGVASKKVMPHA